jgi:hypothetical protein
MQADAGKWFTPDLWLITPKPALSPALMITHIGKAADSRFF